MPQSKVKLILATGTKIEANDSLVVFIDPQYADMCQVIFEEIRFLTGHEHHTVIPVPESAVKIFKVRHRPVMQIDPNFANKLNPQEAKDV
jgi:hypothetical protein